MAGLYVVIRTEYVNGLPVSWISYHRYCLTGTPQSTLYSLSTK